MKVAIVHEWLDTYAGSERVLEQMLEIWPEADLFVTCDFLPPDQRSWLKGRQPRTSFIQRLPFARKRFRWYLGLMPLAVEQHDLTGYDLVLSSNHAIAKGALTGPGQLHFAVRTTRGLVHADATLRRVVERPGLGACFVGRGGLKLERGFPCGRRAGHRDLTLHQCLQRGNIAGRNGKRPARLPGGLRELPALRKKRRPERRDRSAVRSKANRFLHAPARGAVFPARRKIHRLSRKPYPTSLRTHSLRSGRRRVRKCAPPRARGIAA